MHYGKSDNRDSGSGFSLVGGSYDVFGNYSSNMTMLTLVAVSALVVVTHRRGSNVSACGDTGSAGVSSGSGNTGYRKATNS